MNTDHYEEIRLSRALAKAIEQETEQFGQVVPYSVYQAYLNLKKHYQVEIENGVM